MRREGDALTVQGRLDRQQVGVELRRGAALEVGHAGGVQPELPVIGGGVDLQQSVDQVDRLAQAKAALRHAGRADREQQRLEQQVVGRPRAGWARVCR